MHTIHNIGVASQIGAYGDAIETRPNLRWLITSGTPGLSTAGDLPSGIVGQSELAWEHIGRMLEQAGMTVSDIVKVTQYLTRADDISAYAAVRTRFLGDARPASMLLVIPRLVWPEMLVEVEVLAAKPMSRRVQKSAERFRPDDAVRPNAMPILTGSMAIGRGWARFPEVLV